MVMGICLLVLSVIWVVWIFALHIYMYCGILFAEIVTDRLLVVMGLSSELYLVPHCRFRGHFHLPCLCLPVVSDGFCLFFCPCYCFIYCSYCKLYFVDGFLLLECQSGANVSLNATLFYRIFYILFIV